MTRNWPRGRAPMKVVLDRVGADTTTPDGPGWNGPVDDRTGLFACVPTPEVRRGSTGRGVAYAVFDPADLVERDGLRHSVRGAGRCMPRTQSVSGRDDRQRPTPRGGMTPRRV